MSVPVIRFNSFSEDWHLESISSVISNKSKKYDPIKAIEDLPCIELEHLSQQTGEILDTISAKDQKSIKNIFDENSVLFGKLRPYLRKFARPDFKGVCSSEIWVLKSKKLQPDFLFQYIQTDNFFELTQIQAGSKMPRADWESISKGEIYFPNSKEQTKIASFLSAVDEKISQLTQKHELLSQYKQGMMQKLFSQQIRFKADDGSEFGEWENYSLKELLLKVIDNRGKTPDTKPDLDIPLIEINAVGNRNVDYSKVSKFVSKDTFNSWFRAYLEDKDILFSTVGNTAICSIYSSQVQAGIAQNLVGLRARKEVVESVFLYYLLIVESNNKKFKAIEMQAVQPSIKVSQMIHINFEIPKSLTEQIKISNFLSSIDQKIEVVAQQIEQAKQWKKGLLQQMFV
ncbi:hypothetical protein F907_00626 [Acinetobacter colistiniresistens]|uniref:Type I restriction modification DNA specificity domain-containing protein n=1 Tax=Acinetobacter colistiniresistens TaxID=280145 RepID=S3TJ86_9GAMM|nr:MULTISPECIES: restriction endonuclease subunit S [Acinetobacter]EPG41063.1 hypothetical protein F907_00626 [Acinetobacter colistiniresistens]MCI3877534.1 restriction endonuclease subunit S [Acinetobacter higginsii]